MDDEIPAPGVEPMPTLLRRPTWWGWLVERLPPVTVKVLGQSFRGGWMTWGVLFFAGVQVAAAAYWKSGASDPMYALSAELASVATFCSFTTIFAFFSLLAAPLTAFRAVAAEREPTAFDALRLASLAPHGLLAGAILAATLLCGLHLVAALPVLVFTDGLKEVPAANAAVLLARMFAQSFGFIVLAAGAAAIAPTRGSRTAAQIALLGVAGLALWSSAEPLIALVRGRHYAFVRLALTPLDHEELMHGVGYGAWPRAVSGLAVGSSLLWIYYAAAAAALTPRGEDRSSLVRAAVLTLVGALTACAAAQHALAPGGIDSGRLDPAGDYVQGHAWDWLSRIGATEALQRLVDAPIFADAGPLGRYPFVVAAAALLCGAFLVGESPQLSPRVRRGLPATLPGRIFLRWLRPGPGSAYVFCTGLAVGAVVASMFVPYGIDLFLGRAVAWEKYARPTSWSACGYVALFLGAGWTLHVRLNRVRPDVYPAAVSVLLAMFLSLTAATVAQEGTTAGLWDAPGWPVAAFNPVCSDVRGLHRVSPEDRVVASAVVLAAGLAMFVGCLPGVAAELRQQREPPSERALRDDRERAAARRRVSEGPIP